jgi:formiminotetrahydrofolate cyclodeaminase
MLQKPVIEFLRMAADKTPVPGGGSVAALSGALGCAMGHMAAAFSTSEKYAGVKEQVDQTLQAMAANLKSFAEFVEADAAAYAEFSAAQQMPKATEAEKQKRQVAMQLALGNAVKIPRQVCSLSLQSLKVVRVLVETGNKNLVSDVGVAAAMLKSAFDSARLNVEINLAWLKDNPEVARIRMEVESEAKLAEELTALIYARTLEIIRS